MRARAKAGPFVTRSLPQKRWVQRDFAKGTGDRRIEREREKDRERRTQGAKKRGTPGGSRASLLHEDDLRPLLLRASFDLTSAEFQRAECGGIADPGVCARDARSDRDVNAKLRRFRHAISSSRASARALIRELCRAREDSFLQALAFLLVRNFLVVVVIARASSRGETIYPLKENYPSAAWAALKVICASRAQV